MRAAVDGHKEVVEMLLRAGASVDHQGNVSMCECSRRYRSSNRSKRSVCRQYSE